MSSAGAGEGPLEVTVNGRLRVAVGLAPHTSTLDFVRSLGLTGAKEGCAEGECGACAVLVARADGDGGTRWVAVNSCLVPAAALDGQEVLTAEGLGAPDSLHPVQHEMAVRGGSQCGYCTPGFVCAMAAEYYREDRAPGRTGPDDALDEDPAPDHETGPNGFDLHALSGNLCRCTGYRPIRDAAWALGPVPEDDPLGRRQTQPPPPPRATRLTSADGDFVRPATLAEALALLAEQPDAQVLAGGTDWGVETNLRHRRAALTVAVDALPELRELEVTDEWIRIGAALTLTEIERHLGGQVPLLDELLPAFASRLIRNTATLGGNLATASPVGDASPVLLALDATVVLSASEEEREVALADYFTGYRETVRRPGELIRAVLVPTPVLPRASFLKVAKRRSDDISGIAVAIAADLSGGTVRQVRIGLGGAAATPLRALATEEALTGRPWTAPTVSAAAEVLAGEGTPMDDLRASAAYRRAMLGQALHRFYALTAEGGAA